MKKCIRVITLVSVLFFVPTASLAVETPGESFTTVANAALAAPDWDALKIYFETVRAMEMEGELARWSAEDQMKLAQAMVEAGLVAPEDERVHTLLPLCRQSCATVSNQLIRSSATC